MTRGKLFAHGQNDYKSNKGNEKYRKGAYNDYLSRGPLHCSCFWVVIWADTGVPAKGVPHETEVTRRISF